MFPIPEDFARFMNTLFGEEGRTWIKRLPSILATCEDRWHLTIGPPVHNLSFNYVASAVLADGTEVMIKTGLTDEFPAQPKMLQHVNGSGMVRLLTYDETLKAMLMERLRPGVSLRTVKNDELAMQIAADVMRKIWHPLPQGHYPFPTVSDWGQAFTHVRQRYQGGTGPFPSAMFDKAEKIYAELCKSMTNVVLLHGDLHQDNILAAKHETWVAVDPKGVIGEPAYEIGAILRNFWPDILTHPNPAALTKHRIDQLAEILGFDRERVYLWGFSQAVLSSLWGIEETGKLELEGLYFAELLKTIKR